VALVPGAEHVVECAVQKTTIGTRKVAVARLAMVAVRAAVDDRLEAPLEVLPKSTHGT
jgi:hypothetical protein